MITDSKSLLDVGEHTLNVTADLNTGKHVEF